MGSYAKLAIFARISSLDPENESPVSTVVQTQGLIPWVKKVCAQAKRSTRQRDCSLIFLE